MEDPFAFEDWDLLAAQLVSSLNSAVWRWLARAAAILLWLLAARYREWLPLRFLTKVPEHVRDLLSPSIYYLQNDVSCENKATDYLSRSIVSHVTSCCLNARHSGLAAEAPTVAKRTYSPECVEGEYSEVRIAWSDPGVLDQGRVP